MTRGGFQCDGTIDIECADWDRFRLGCVYRGPGTGRVFYDLDDLIAHLVAHPGHYWAHAGGIYDLLAICDRLDRRGVKYWADPQEHRVARLRFAGVTIRDSYALVPLPLDEAAAIGGEKAPELPWSCECGRDCGGYCKIPARCDLPFDPDLEDYCMADCRVLYAVLHALKAHADKHGLILKGTLGSTAWATAKKTLGLPDADLPWGLWRDIRRADKGGRIAVVRPNASGPGAHFDIRNAYPGALARTPVPLGHVRELGSREGKLALHRDRPGIYQATVRVPDSSFLPPLPWRSPGALGKISYPIGEFSGSWALPELVAAVLRGVEVVKIHSAIVWSGEVDLFSSLMHEWYRIRREVGRDTPLGAWQSRLAKALTGKFAEQPERSRYVGNPEEIRICTREKWCRNGCTGRCGRYQQIDLWGRLWSAPYFKLAPSGHAHWSAYLRAATRVQWLEAAERCSDGLCYGDTDSLWTIGRNTPEPISDDLGAWELKHTFTDLEVRAPKVYAFVDGSGRKIYRGAPGLTEDDWRRGQAVIDRGVLTLRQAARGTKGLFRAKVKRWTIPGHGTDPVLYGDRRLDPLTGMTHPLDAQEHRDKLTAQRGQRDHVKAGRTAAK